MLDFRAIQLNDKELVESYLKRYEQGEADEQFRVELKGCDYSFASILCWRDMYLTKIAEEDGALYFRYKDAEHKPAYLFPLLRSYGTESYKSELTAALNRIAEDVSESGQTLRMTALTSRMVQQIESLTDRKWTAEQNRDTAEYIYTTSRLSALNGKHLQPKRNQMNKFRKEHENWRTEEMSATNIQDCRKLFQKWSGEHHANGASPELLAFNQALQHYESLGLYGLILYVDEKAAAFSLGTTLHTPEGMKTFDLMFEKADPEVMNAYTAINQQMAARLKEKGYEYVNREDDMGLENLRKAKLSYHPCELMEVYHMVSE